MSINDPAELDEALEVAVGRRAPYTQVGDWVLLSGVDPEARTLYWGLSAHISVSRDDTEVWPSLPTLARIVGLKKPENVSRYMLQLEVIGAVDVVRVTSGLIRRNRYIINQTPPPWYAGPQSLGDWYALNRAPKGETAEERKQREAGFDRWLEGTRAALKAHCDKVAKQRAAARKAKAPVPPVEQFAVPPLQGVREESRTPATGSTGRPAKTRKAAGRAVPPLEGGRTPATGGHAPPPQGVKQDEGQLDELSLSGEAVDEATTAAGAEAVTDERDDRAARNNDQARPVPGQRAAEAVDVDAMTAALPGLGYADAVELAPLVAAAVADGWTTGGLYEYLAARCDTARVSFPPAVYRKHLKALPAPQAATPAPAAPKVSRAELVAACTECDEYGQITTEAGVANCKHPEAAEALAAA